MGIVIFLFVLIIISFCLYDRTKYKCPCCDESTFNKKCSNCNIAFGYSDRMSDSSLSIEKALKYFQKNKLLKKNKSIVSNNSVRVNMTQVELLEQEHNENANEIIEQFVKDQKRKK